MNRIMLTLVVLAGTSASAVCEAQWTPWGFRPTVVRCTPVVYGVRPFYAYPSTPVEAARRGQAAVVLANGVSSFCTSRATINYQEARSKHIDNAAKWTNAYRERKRSSESERAKDRAEALAARDRYLAAKKPDNPPRLTPTQLDRNNGELNWPQALMDGEYFEYREKLEQLFEHLVRCTTPSGLAREICATSAEMKRLLKKNIRTLPPNEYLAARKFIDGIACEGALSAG